MTAMAPRSALIAAAVCGIALIVGGLLLLSWRHGVERALRSQAAAGPVAAAPHPPLVVVGIITAGHLHANVREMFDGWAANGSRGAAVVVVTDNATGLEFVHPPARVMVAAHCAIVGLPGLACKVCVAMRHTCARDVDVVMSITTAARCATSLRRRQLRTWTPRGSCASRTTPLCLLTASWRPRQRLGTPPRRARLVTGTQRRYTLTPTRHSAGRGGTRSIRQAPGGC